MQGACKSGTSPGQGPKIPGLSRPFRDGWHHRDKAQNSGTVPPIPGRLATMLLLLGLRNCLRLAWLVLFMVTSRTDCSSQGRINPRRGPRLLVTLGTSGAPTSYFGRPPPSTSIFHSSTGVRRLQPSQPYG